ncbi:MAG: hypothetical protein IJT54_04460 [Candidatus Methanomethylophilaceae archaeon]|nr:hypothetical protein [Candidatus Methanomethylophilaceae archaeon]
MSEDRDNLWTGMKSFWSEPKKSSFWGEKPKPEKIRNPFWGKPIRHDEKYWYRTDKVFYDAKYDSICPFCGSDELEIDRVTTEDIGNGNVRYITDICCYSCECIYETDIEGKR